MTRPTILALALVALALLPAPSCQPTPSPTPPPAPPPVADAGRPVPPPPAPTPPPTPPPAPPPPAPGDAYDDACASLRAAGCSEGSEPNCAATMRHADQAGITKVPVACLIRSTSRAQVWACGFVRCR